MLKVLNKACQVLTVAAILTTLVLFFLGFATFSLTDGVTDNASAFQFSFGTKVAGAELQVSAKILFNIIVTILALLTSVITFFSKSNGLKYFTTAITAVVAVFMLVVALGEPTKFIDARFTAGNVLAFTSIKYTPLVLISSIAMFVATAAGVGHFLLSDYIDVLQSKGAKLPLLKRIWKFFKDYKSEVKKIVWPGFGEVLKNTGIVLVMFVIIGLVVWLVDGGLRLLLELIWK